ncbi:MAG TPA: hypothetical protein VGZ32_07475 [Actinocrinis sp.]|uniref:hypothetical protein n=1 Tax=Actinocrinis sp. TaxID=1920516 RepID=UPI002DDCD110|nr:hypothetical protein [Actinocrinis sp.]HEV3170161.1 hypothetical protein [Actinocrinis sp.]
MTSDVVFFIAPDDDTAAATRLKGPGPAFTSVVCHGFDPDDAVVEWEMYFEAPNASPPPVERLYQHRQPRWVAPILNDGLGVFAVPAELTSALAKADASRLVELASRWSERLRYFDGDDMTADDPQAILQGVVRLAATVVNHGGGLYCWHY